MYNLLKFNDKDTGMAVTFKYHCSLSDVSNFHKLFQWTVFQVFSIFQIILKQCCRITMLKQWYKTLSSSADLEWFYSISIYLFKLHNENLRPMCEISLTKLTIKIPERRHWNRSGVFIGSCEHILRIFPAFPLLTLNK